MKIVFITAFVFFAWVGIPGYVIIAMYGWRKIHQKQALARH